MTGPRSVTSSSHGSGIPSQQQLLQQQQQLLTSHSRPPAQVYTRGTTGAVKTHVRNRDNLQRQQQTQSQQQQQPHRRTPSQTRQDELLLLGGGSRGGGCHPQHRSRLGDRSVQSEASASTNRSGTTNRSNRSAGGGPNKANKDAMGGGSSMAPELAKLHVKVARRVTEGKRTLVSIEILVCC